VTDGAPPAGYHNRVDTDGDGRFDKQMFDDDGDGWLDRTVRRERHD
jgi:hypothetical protein